MIRVLLVDDDPLVRSGLRLMLTPETDMEIAGEAADGQQAVAAVLELRPDVVLMDVRMPVLDGIEATRRIVGAHLETRVVVLTTFELDAYVFDSIRAGASGFLLKRTAPEEVVAAVRAAAAGDALLTPAVTRKLIGEFAKLSDGRPVTDVDHLTDRETEVLRLLGRGLSNTEIAEVLVIAESTAKTHVKRILSKLGLRDRAQAVIVAYETGLVVPRRGGGSDQG
jgi:DNA-binding NarL/FixJ family response regulator